MTNELSTERAIEALYTVRAYYASLTAGYPKGKDCRGIGDVMCSEIANSCLMAIKALEQQPSEDCISREAVIKHICESKECYKDECKGRLYKRCYDLEWIYALPSVTPQPKMGKWIDTRMGKEEFYGELFVCSECNGVNFYENYCPNCGAKMEVEE